MEKQNTISDHVIQFSRFLRGHKFSIGPEEEALALQALAIIPYNKPDYFKNALRATLTKSRNQLNKFDDLYAQYWSEIKKAENSKQKDLEEEKKIPKPKPQESGVQVIKKWLSRHSQKDLVKISSYDQVEAFAEQDFSSFKKEELSDTLRYTADLVRKLSNKTGRRFVSAKSKRSMDLRGILRRNIGRSDEFIYLKHRKKKVEKLKLVLICDVSKSMEMYSRFLIQFMYGLNQASTKIETFVFSTKLERITKSLAHSDFEAVLEELKVSFDQWSSGTKIGTSLLDFSTRYGYRFIDAKTKVIILSDGWDTGEVERVKEAMAGIKRRCSSIIWLNPLSGNKGFRPETACLVAALPFIDVFQPANSIDDLKELIQKLDA